MTKLPADWPAPGPIDLTRQDLPHASAATEWWYVHCHLETADQRNLALFASFFRVLTGHDEQTHAPTHAHSLTWALIDLDAERYYPDCFVDAEAPRMGLERLDRGEGTKDDRLRRALREILERGNVPYPDHMFEQVPFVASGKLDLDFDGNRYWKNDDGSYGVRLFHDYYKCGAELRFEPQKPAIRHGKNGVVTGHEGGDMFYYFIPRCAVTGSVTLNATTVPVTSGSGWVDHEFGGHFDEDAEPNENIAWDWCGVQLDDGSEISAYVMYDTQENTTLEQCAVVIAPDGSQQTYDDVQLTGAGEWRSTRSFYEYPTSWQLSVPRAGISLTLDGAFRDQEFLTLISKPAFWEGRCNVVGTKAGAKVSGDAFIERSGHKVLDNLEQFFKAVGKEVRKSVADLLPFDPTYEQVRDLVASEARDHYMDGVDLDQFVRTGVVPVREVTDRGGKGWRSYAALACCDVVGGDSREFVRWLAMPELMHVGSLIVDDVQDRSTVRRGGPTCHEAHGDAIAINAGTSCYFMGQNILHSTKVSANDKLRLYDLYFEALRAGHAGQAADIEGLDRFVPPAVETGDSDDLERRVLAVHRLKTAAPAGALSRMGGIIGDGTDEQVEGLGRYFESLGVAFQIVDDVLNVRGFKGDSKSRGEDISHGKVTLPVAKAFSRLEAADRVWLWDTIQSKPTELEVVQAVIEKMEACGAVEACAQDARDRVERAWTDVQPLLEDSIVKLMLRAFGWYVLERHY